MAYVVGSIKECICSAKVLKYSLMVCRPFFEQIWSTFVVENCRIFTFWYFVAERETIQRERERERGEELD